ncbi:MAG TPA: carbohydrate ABC transporter permease [Chthonomonadaceae bacterium]|nr:carbohydrate ABC transporter permease [Chthonomonadaceae bacterium]
MPLIPQVGRRRPKARLVLIGIAAFLWLGVLLHLFPVAWMVSASFKPTREIFEEPFHLLPRQPSLASYKLMFSTVTANGMNLNLNVFRYPLVVYLRNSILISGLTVLLQLPVTAMAAYAVSKLHGRRSALWLFYFFIGTLMIPGQIALVPRFLLLSHFPWPSRHVPHFPFTGAEMPTYSFIGTYWGVVLPAAFSAFNFLLLKGFFDTLPTELIEAARIDGASELMVLRKIMLPLARPVMAVVTYFAFTGAWNDFLGPWIILMSEQGKWPLSVVIYKLQMFLMNWQPSQGTMDPAMQQLMSSGVGFNALMALAVIESIPMFIAFLIFREQLMRGIQITGLKG